MFPVCTSCGVVVEPENALKIETGSGEHIFCKECLKTARKRIVQNKYKTPDDLQLLKDINKFLKETVH